MIDRGEQYVGLGWSVENAEKFVAHVKARFVSRVEKCEFAIRADTAKNGDVYGAIYVIGKVDMRWLWGALDMWCTLVDSD